MDAGSPVKQQSQVPDFVVSEQELDELQKLTETIARAAVSDANTKVGRPLPVSSPSTLTSETIVSEENGSPTPIEFPKEESLEAVGSATGVSVSNQSPENKILRVSHDMNEQI